MENGEAMGSVSTPGVVVRDYAPADYSACRMLWVELTEHHRRIYEDPSIGGGDPGGAFDDYLALPQRVASWPISMAWLSVLRVCLTAVPAARLNRWWSLSVFAAGEWGGFLSGG